MKKALIVLFAALLCCLAVSALADSPIYSLYRQTGEDYLLSGTAMYCISDEEKALFLGAGEVHDGDALILYGDDGQWPVLYALRLEGTGALLLYTSPEAGAKLEIASMRVTAPSLTSFDALNAGEDWVYGAPVSVAEVTVDGLDAYLVTLSQDTLPGAVLYTRDDEQAVVLTAKYGERPFTWLGMDMMTALSAQEHESAKEVRLALQGEGENDGAEGFLTGFTMTYEAGLMKLHVDTPADGAEGYRVYMMDMVNTYYSYYETENVSLSAQAVPGHSYAVWVQALPGELSHSLPYDTARLLDVPQAGAVDRYGYHEEGAWFTSADRKYAADEEVPEKSPISLSALLGGEIAYLQVISVYETDHDVNESLVFAFTAPDGSCLSELAGYLYMGNLARDVWNADLTEILTEGAQYLQNPYGTWKLQWFYNGDLAGECEFELAE